LKQELSMPAQNDTNHGPSSAERPQFDSGPDDLQTFAAPARSGDDIGGFVRRNPLAALVVAAGIGLLVGRMLK
jgi:ElaB/YqjD/DUF883 family membrane-anchored ribosome-binding protein